jgi:predicted enzyme related to lactoylglutathione lyase
MKVGEKTSLQDRSPRGITVCVRMNPRCLGQYQAMHRETHPYLRGELVVVIDCSSLGRSARFWAAALGYARDKDPAGRYQSLLPADGNGAEILLQQVPEAKHGKNRVHLDLRTRDLEAETGRLAALGARVLTARPVSEHGWRWHVLADPDGNEFCVLQPPAGYWPD